MCLSKSTLFEDSEQRSQKENGIRDRTQRINNDQRTNQVHGYSTAYDGVTTVDVFIFVTFRDITFENKTRQRLDFLRLRLVLEL